MSIGMVRRKYWLEQVWLDNRDTWSTATGARQRRDRRRALAGLYLPPTVLALGAIAIHLQLANASGLLSGASVFTALLFGLLWLVFNLGVTLRKDDNKSPHGLRTVVSDLRANVTYTAVVAILLTSVLAIASALTPPATSAAVGLCFGWSFPIVWLATHLALCLIVILRRFRTAFNYLTR